ncbi:limbic system-associated membrane protein-like isoform X2 [Antedon mediterranea]
MSIIIGSKFYSLSDDNPCATQLPPNMRYQGDNMIQLCKRNEATKGTESSSVPDINNDGRPVIWGTISLEASLGENALLKCNVKNLTNNSKVMWFHKERVRVLYITNKRYDVNNHTRILVDEQKGTYNLQILNVTPGDAGTYVCQIQPKFENKFLDIQPKLNVLVPSTILRIEPNSAIDRKIYFNLGENVYLNCVVNGIPTPNITWTRSDTLLNKTIINGKILLPNIKKSDSGTYICDAVNMVKGRITMDRQHVCVIVN